RGTSMSRSSRGLASSWTGTPSTIRRWSTWSARRNAPFQLVSRQRTIGNRGMDDMMNRRTHFTMVLAVVLLAVAAGGQTKGDSDVNLLQRLRPEHPRLIVLDADVERTRALLSTD